MQVMEEELVIELCVCGYHVCKDIWEAAIGEELPCERETTCRNIQDRYACSCEKRRHEELECYKFHSPASTTNTAKISTPRI